MGPLEFHKSREDIYLLYVHKGIFGVLASNGNQLCMVWHILAYLGHCHNVQYITEISSQYTIEQIFVLQYKESTGK